MDSLRVADEAVGAEQKRKSREPDCSPLYKEFNAAEASGSKKNKKTFTSMKEYTSEAEGRKEPGAAKPAGTESSYDELPAGMRQAQVSSTNLSPQPSAQQSKRLRTQKQQLLLLSEKKGANVGLRQHQPSPYKSKRKMQKSTEDNFEELDHNSLMDEENAPQRPAMHGELTFTSLTESNNKLLFHKSIELKQKGPSNGQAHK